MKKVLFIKNTLVLTVTALLLRSIGIVFKVWLTAKIGAEGIGLYQVIFSVYVLAATFATSGICTAVTRMVTERLAAGDIKGSSNILKISIWLSLFLAAATMIVILSFSKFIAVTLVGDARAEPAIRILCFSLPFMGVSSCLRGYFLARRRSVPNSLGQIIEQVVRIAVTVLFIGRYAQHGIGAAAAAVMCGDCAAELVFTLFIYLWYRLDRRGQTQRAAVPYRKRKALKEILRISTPISAGRYLHTALRTIENIITPGCFSAYTGSRNKALEQFGMVKGMALPLLMFPASLLTAVSTLLVPEITEAAAQKNKHTVCRAVEKVFTVTALSSFFIIAVFFCCSGQIGRLVYKSNEVGWLLRVLSPLIPFMYVDLIADGILKGLDQQKVLFRNCVTDSAIRILLVWLLVPKMGMQGFFVVMIFSNLFTAGLAIVRVVRITGVKPDYSRLLFRPLVYAAVAAAVTSVLCSRISGNDFVYFILAVGLITLIYCSMLLFSGDLSHELSPFKKRIHLTKKQKRFKYSA